jgi:two-component system nitrate/nitrite response regulator NarL
MKRIRLVIVDDHRLFREGLVSLLRSEPQFEVVGEASSGPAALRLADELRPDVALVDLMMPIMAGPEVIERLLTCRPELRVVVLTASEDYVDLIRATRAGATGYILKDVDAATLFDAIRRVHSGGAALSNNVTPKVLEILRHLPAPRVPDAALTPRQQEVLALTTHGVDNAGIARQLVISENTVKAHLAHVRAKLGVRGRSDLIAWGQQSR